MKNLLPFTLLVVLLLSACAPAKATFPPTPNWANSHSAPTPDWSAYEPSIEAFQFGEQCPHLCWLGINPGVTKSEEVEALLRASDQIDPNLELSETGVVVKWYTEKTKKLTASAYVRFDKGVASSIAFNDLAPFTLGDFINLAGEPDGVNIDMNIYGDIMEMPYGAYYFSGQILVGADAADTGLHANDTVTSLILNVPYEHKLFRKWVGYGHLAEYFAGKDVHQHPGP
jgi:hypothetical protein